jgi:hypothetical protein
MVFAELTLVPRTAELEQARQVVVPDVGRPHDFGEAALERAAVHLHLPEPVLRLNEALSKEEVIDILRVNVRHTRFIAMHADRVLQTGQRDPPVDLRECRAGQ